MFEGNDFDAVFRVLFPFAVFGLVALGLGMGFLVWRVAQWFL